MFSNEGIGTLIHANEYQQIRAAMKKDVHAIQVLTKGVEADELVNAAAPTSRRRSATTSSSRSTGTRWHAWRCTSIPKQKGELACLYVSPRTRTRGSAGS